MNMTLLTACNYDDFTEVRVKNMVWDGRLHPRRRHLHIAMLFLEIWTALRKGRVEEEKNKVPVGNGL